MEGSIERQLCVKGHHATLKRSEKIRTFLFHVYLETFLKSTGLTLIPTRDIHDTIAIFLANVIQVPKMIRDEQIRKVMLQTFCGTQYCSFMMFCIWIKTQFHWDYYLSATSILNITYMAAKRRMLLLKNPLQPSHEATP